MSIAINYRGTNRDVQNRFSPRFSIVTGFAATLVISAVAISIVDQRTIVRVTFSAPMSPRGLECVEAYEVIRLSDSAVLAVYGATREVSATPTYVDLEVDEQADGEDYQVAVYPIGTAT